MQDQPTPAAEHAGTPQKVIGLREAIAIIVGIVIGAGIFKAPALVAGMTGSATWMFSAWLLGGAISLAGALCYAELATAYSHTGGDYHFLRRAYGRSVSFLFGWARFSVITTGSIALLAFVFGDYMHELMPLPALDKTISESAYAALAIVVLSWINLRGTYSAAATQSWLTALEVLGLLLIAAAAFVTPGQAAAALPAPGQSPPAAASLGMAMVFVLLTYGGWNEAAYISAELKDVRRNMVRSLVWSIFIITCLYLLVTWAYWKVLGIEGVARSDAVAADVLQAAFGQSGARLISAIVAVSALTSINATMIVGARTSHAVGHDWPVLSMLGAWDGRRGTPANALRIQCVAALLLVAVGTWTGSGFKSMVEFTAPVFWLFFLLAGISLFVLRRREPSAERPFRVPLYPLLPALFCATCAFMLWSSLSYVYSQSLGGLNAAWIGVAVLAAGLVLLLLMRSRHDERRRSAFRSIS
ncbi:APC family permease [Noviherbaspirillum denitrificans]|uniref:Amino acid permease n=1 Tax=Noviherbaspirillum denitrificans TaxID=1968433 RepID=A0A254TG15_9BURK|nr:amino acid permease [Noviherbaspirillum denitrificans]OWW21599.1 amino acid permease [Noviherbaspirillum denitrificans]